MKCPICNTENHPDASTCQQCGFSLSLGQSTWPGFPTVEIPEPVAMPQWPESPGIETLTVSSESIEEKVEAIKAKVPPPVQPPDDDELARSHIVRGLEAMREGLPDQAQWELEQARDLADDLEIASIAQAQLDVLHEAAARAARERVQPIERLAPQSDPDQPRPTDWNPNQPHQTSLTKSWSKQKHEQPQNPTLLRH